MIVDVDWAEMSPPGDSSVPSISTYGPLRAMPVLTGLGFKGR
jgi:hypothetical protein